LYAPLPLRADATRTSEVACIDHLHRLVARFRCEHIATGCDPRDPVGEAVGRVVRADDQARADDDAAIAHHLLDNGFARRLQLAVVRAEISSRICEPPEWRILVEPRDDVSA